MRTWHLLIWLLITAVLYHYARGPILVVAFIVAFVWCWLAFARRFPRTAWFVFGFCRGLFGRR